MVSLEGTSQVAGRRSVALPLPPEWRDWLRLNRDRGCDRHELLRRALAHGCDARQVAEELQAPELLGTSSGDPVPPEACTDPAETPLLDPAHQPRAWRLDTPLAQILEIPELLSREECSELIHAIDRSLVPSTVTTGAADYRTSQTCHLTQVAPSLTEKLNRRFTSLFSVESALAEPMQGQRYDTGQCFRAHTDWFTPGTAEYEEHASLGGQRTWTLMVYLNAVQLGGETAFPRIGRRFTPVAGLGLAWNNLHADGSVNHATLHEALPVQEGRKYVITQWFRLRPGRRPTA